MTQQEYRKQVEEDLLEGYDVKMISRKTGFKMKVHFEGLTSRGDTLFSAVGIEGSKFATVSMTFLNDELEKFIIRNSFEVYK